MFKSRRIHPRITSVQNVFFGRLYSGDMILMYRALTGKYIEHPSLFLMTGGLTFFHDVTQALGLLGAPGTTALTVGNWAEIFYNEAVKNTVFTLNIAELRNAELWTGWDAFTELLKKDIEQMGLEPPLKFPPLKFKLRKFTLTPEQIAALSESSRFVYYIYRGDVEWTEYGFTTASQYSPEMIPLLASFFPDFERIMDLYRQWITARILGNEASYEARVMSKVIFLSNYRWYALVADLLSPSGEIFQTAGFQRGLMKIADMIRIEAERIRVIPPETPRPPF